MGSLASIAVVTPVTIPAPGNKARASALKRGKSCNGDCNVLSLELAERGRNCIRCPVFRAIFLQLIRVAFDVAWNFSGIGWRFSGRQVPRTGHRRERRETGFPADRRTVITVEPNPVREIGLQILVEDQLAALRTFDPKIFRGVTPQQRTNFRRHNVRDPIHARPCLCSVEC